MEGVPTGGDGDSWAQADAPVRGLGWVGAGEVVRGLRAPVPASPGGSPRVCPLRAETEETPKEVVTK